MAGYGVFAQFYDSLTGDVDYGRRTDDLLSLFEKYDRRPTLLLDLACGTGGFSVEMASRGIDVIGVDPSPEMLTAARQKAGDREILFVCQRAEELELYGSVDGAICCLDSVNHFDGSDAVRAAFRRVAAYLEPGRLFLFDMNSLYKQRVVLGNNTFIYDTDTVYLVWQNELEDDRTVQIYLDFFCPEDGRYARYAEDFCETGYSVDEMTGFLSEAGLETLALYDGENFGPVCETSERILFVARKG